MELFPSIVNMMLYLRRGSSTHYKQISYLNGDGVAESRLTVYVHAGQPFSIRQVHPLRPSASATRLSTSRVMAI